ncbi:hypothetical protein K2X40_02030 [Candidatus Babeliales bacterium]|nr:hypothetical protein [Candidatus Babeliales bacterium]
MEHCCEIMLNELNDPRTPFSYDKILRQYYVICESRICDQLLSYCPWCGKKLPEVLNEEYYDIIYDELKLEPAENVLETKGLPEEFKSDEWWKKRGL